MEKIENKKKCPLCNHILYEFYEGLGCKNWKCKLQYKCNNGWILKNTESKYYNRNQHQLQFYREFGYNSKYLWLQFRSIILLRDNYKCIRCNSQIELNIHHIIEQSENISLKFYAPNCITLCKECHLLIHKFNKNKFKKW